MYLAGPASANSTFGGFELDGDLFASAALDWSSPSVQPQPVATDPIGGADNSVFSGSKEDNPDGWDVKTNAPGKDDIGPVYEFSHIDPATNHEFVYFAFERASSVGTVNFVVELNQKPNHINKNGVSVPTRTAGDLRFNVTQNGNNPGLAAHGADQFDGTTYVPLTPPPLAFDSAVNTTAINPLPGGTDPVANANGGQIPAFQFAEFGFDLTQFVDPKHPCNIPPFDTLNSRSRASDSNTAEVKDFIAPVALNLPGSCFDLKIQKFKADGTTALPGATFLITPNPNTGLGSLTVTDGGAGDPDGTADGVIEFPNAQPLAAGGYQVQETVAPSGYLLATPATKTSAAALSFHSDTLSYNDALGSVTFTKVNKTTGNPQCCAHFQLTNPPGVVNSKTINVVDNGSNDAAGVTAGTITVNNLQTGTWQVAETQAPAGFGMDTATPTFTIDDANHTATLAAPTFSDPPAPTIDVGILKGDSPDPVNAGGTLTYTLTVTNNGTNATADPITVTDPIPSTIDNPQIVSAPGWNCSISVPPPAQLTLTCTLPAGLASGASASDITFSGTVDDSALGAAPSTTGSISNTATVAMNNDSVAANNTSTANTNVVSPDLRILKSDNVSPSSATVGSQLVYTLKVRNVGSGPTTGGITVTDQLDNSLTYVSASGSSWTCGEAANLVTCTNPGPVAANADAGDITITVVPTQAVAAPGLQNTATVSTAHDNNAANNSSSIKTVVVPTPANTGVAFADSCGPPESITVSATNTGGTDEVLNVTKPDGSPDTITVPANTPVATAGTTKNYPLTGGNSVTVAGAHLVGSPVSHTFSLNCAGPPPPPPPPGNPVLTLAKSSVPTSGSTVHRGDTVTYTLDYANTGTAAASNVVVSDVLPADTTFSSASAGGTYDAPTNTVSWTIANLSNGTSGSVSFVVSIAQSATDGETIDNVGLVGATGVAPVQSNHVDLTVSVPVTPPTPTLSEVKKVDQTVSNYGDTLTYTLIVTAGGADQTGVVATDQVPTGTEYVQASAQCSTGCNGSENAGVVSWSIGNMAVGDSVTLTFQVTITRPTQSTTESIPAETITNVGSVGSDQVDPIDSNQVQTQVVAVLGEKVILPPKTKPQPSPLPFTGLPFNLAQMLVLSTLMIVTGLWLTRPRRRRPLA